MSCGCKGAGRTAKLGLVGGNKRLNNFRGVTGVIVVRPIDIVKGTQIRALHYIVRRGIVAIGAHDDAVIPGSPRLGNDI